MRNSTRPIARSPLVIAAAVLEVILGIGALGGGLALMLGPQGQILPLPLSNLAGSPFDSYFVPGLILFGILGVCPVLVAVVAWRGQRWAPVLTVGVGGALLIWLAVQIAIIGYSDNPPLQPAYLVMGVLIATVGLAWGRATGSPLHIEGGRSL